MPFRRSLLEIQPLGVSGVELEAVGDLAPKSLTATGRRELKHLLRSHGLDCSAVVCPLRHGLDEKERQDERIEHVMAAMTFSFDLGPRIVLVQAGRIPEKDDDPRSVILRESLTALAAFGDRTGAQLALDSGADSPDVLAAFLDHFDTASLGVHFNPANFLINGHDPYKAARLLNRRILNTHAKDARSISPNKLQEVPLGHGSIDWLQLLAVFEEIEYRGYLTVAPDHSSAPVPEVTAAVQFLQRFVR